MDLFPNGGFVRLQSRANGKYVHADGDWVGVSLRPLGAAQPLEAVWRVGHMAVNQGVVAIYLQLQNAAYGRYLSFSTIEAQSGHRGSRAVQADRFAPPNDVDNDNELWWRVQRVEPNQNYVRLRCAHNISLELRANGRHRTWNTGVTVDRELRPRLTTMMQWTVEVVPASPQIQGGRRGLLFWRRRNIGIAVHQHPARRIRHVRASDEGNFVQDHTYWPSFDFNDHSVFNLRIHLGQLQKEKNGDFTLCMRPGSHGRLMPLVTDLPSSSEPMHIVVFRTGSPAAAALVYPQIAAPAQ